MFIHIVSCLSQGESDWRMKARAVINPRDTRTHTTPGI